MFEMIHRSAPGRLMTRQLPALVAAFLIAEFFYKFKSFTLECLAFLVTWYAIGAAVNLLLPERNGDR